MLGRSHDGVLAKGHAERIEGIQRIVGVVAQRVPLDADSDFCPGFEFGGDPRVDGLEGFGVGVAVDATFCGEDKVAEEVATEDGDAEGEEGLEDGGLAGVVRSDEGVGGVVG